MRVLFVCNGNVARSQEAEAFFNALAPNKHDAASSAGVNVKVGKLIDPHVVEIMNELNHDISGAQRKFVTKEMAKNADIIVSFKLEAELPEYLHNNPKVQYWEVADPQHQSLEFHRAVRDEIRAKVSVLVHELHGQNNSLR